jgi:hypothetical protein
VGHAEQGRPWSRGGRGSCAESGKRRKEKRENAATHTFRPSATARPMIPGVVGGPPAAKGERRPARRSRGGARLWSSSRVDKEPRGGPASRDTEAGRSTGSTAQEHSQRIIAGASVPNRGTVKRHVGPAASPAHHQGQISNLARRSAARTFAMSSSGTVHSHIASSIFVNSPHPAVNNVLSLPTRALTCLVESKFAG